MAGFVFLIGCTMVTVALGLQFGLWVSLVCLGILFMFLGLALA